MLKLPFIILLFVVLACTGTKRAAKTPEPVKPTPTTDRKLQADVQLSNAGVTVTNTDIADFPALTLKFNLTQLGGNDGEANVGGLMKGKSITIPYGEFTTGTTRFNPRTTKILTIYVKGGDGSAKLFLCPGTRCQPS